MKILTVFTICLFVATSVISQVTITSDDMPEIGDTFRISITSISPIGPELTGENYSWDFSDLQYESQTIDSFVHINETPFTYNLIFIYPFVSTIAKPALAPETPGVAPITITESYDFFKETATSFTKTGFAAKINDLPTPRKYDNPELLYSFPLTYGIATDSSLSYWDIEVPGFGLYGQTIKRVNQVDGWGTLTTPYGIFECIRLKSIVNSRDTFYVETYSIGYAVDRPELTEYKWITNEMGIPLLQIDQSTMVTNIRYRDSARVDLLQLPIITENEIEIELFPNPAKDVINLKINKCKDSFVNLRLTDYFGNVLKLETFDVRLYSQTELSLQLENLNLKKGIYFLQIQGDSFEKSLPVVIL